MLIFFLMKKFLHLFFCKWWFFECCSICLHLTNRKMMIMMIDGGGSCNKSETMKNESTTKNILIKFNFLCILKVSTFFMWNVRDNNPPLTQNSFQNVTQSSSSSPFHIPLFIYHFLSIISVSGWFSSLPMAITSGVFIRKLYSLGGSRRYSNRSWKWRWIADY